MRTRTFAALAAVLFAPAALAAAPPAGEWTAWLGCWRAETEGAPLVCVLPGEDATTVRIATIENGAIAQETVVRADGVGRPIEEGGCSGSERAFFSADGRRVYTRAELACTGLGRTSTGVLAMISPTEWVDVQALTVNGQHAARSIRYHAASPSEVPTWIEAELPRDQQLAQEAARLDASAPLDVAAVVEASRTIAAPAVEALLAARQHGFGLNAQKLLALKEQGVPETTIDVMVALSYPTRFAVAEDQPRMALDESGRYGEQSAWSGDYCYDPYWDRLRFGSECDRYGYTPVGRYGYGYGYSPFGYDPYGWRYGARPVVVIVRGTPDGELEPQADGAVVKGRGYTRRGTSVGTASPRQPSVDRAAPTRPSVDASRASPTSRGSSAGSSTTGSSGSSTGSERKAKPRGGGG